MYKKVDFDYVEKFSGEINNFWKSKKIGTLFKIILIIPIIVPLLFIGQRGFGGEEFFVTIIISFIGLAPVLWIYSTIINRKKRKLKFPQNTPKRIIDIRVQDISENFIKASVYEECITIQTTETIEGYKYEVLGRVDGDNITDFLIKAYNLKADAIIGSNKSSTVLQNISNGVTKGSIKTTNLVEEHYSGTAIKLIEPIEKVITNNEDSTIAIGSELEKLLKLKNDGILNEKEFTKAKKAILK